MNDHPTNQAAEDIRLDRYFVATWRAKWLILVVALAAAALAAWDVRRQPTVYTANAFLEVGRVWKEPLADTYVVERTVNSDGFKRELAEKLGVRPAQVRSRLQADTVTAGPNRTRYPILLQISASAPAEDDAVRLAQAASDELLARHAKLFNDALATHRAREQRLEGHWKALQGQAGAARELLIKVEDELDEVKFNNASPTVTKPTALVEAIVAAPSPPPPFLQRAAAAGLLAAVAAVALIVLVAYFKPLRQAATDKPDA